MAGLRKIDRTFTSKMEEEKRNELYSSWKNAVLRSVSI